MRLRQGFRAKVKGAKGSEGEGGGEVLATVRLGLRIWLKLTSLAHVHAPMPPLHSQHPRPEHVHAGYSRCAAYQRNRSGYAAVAHREGLVMVWPQASQRLPGRKDPLPAWNSSQPNAPPVDDVGFIEQVILREVQAQAGAIDAARVYLTGHALVWTWLCVCMCVWVCMRVCVYIYVCVAYTMEELRITHGNNIHTRIMHV